MPLKVMSLPQVAWAEHRDRGGELDRLQLREHRGGVDDAGVAGDRGNARNLDEVRDHPPENVRIRPGVGVDDQDQLVADERNRVVQRHGLPLVHLLADVADPARARELVEDLRRRVGRSVVDDDDLDLGPIERPELADGVRDHRLLVVGADQYRDRRPLVERVERRGVAFAMPPEDEARRDPVEGAHDRIAAEEEEHARIRVALNHCLEEMAYHDGQPCR
jgi:hypothetical protein